MWLLCVWEIISLPSILSTVLGVPVSEKQKKGKCYGMSH